MKNEEESRTGLFFCVMPPSESRNQIGDGYLRSAYAVVVSCDVESIARLFRVLLPPPHYPRARPA